MKLFIILGCVCCSFSIFAQSRGLYRDIQYRKGKKLFRKLAEAVILDYENHE